MHHCHGLTIHNIELKMFESFARQPKTTKHLLQHHSRRGRSWKVDWCGYQPKEHLRGGAKHVAMQEGE